VFDRSALRAEAIGRCWSQGRLLAWLADSFVDPASAFPLDVGRQSPLAQL
jgi:hypothetical protein